MKRFLLLAAIPCAGALAGCPGDGTGLDALGNPIGGSLPPDTTLADTTATLAQAVQPIFTANCAFSGCHGGTSPAQGMNLTSGLTFTSTVNVPAQELPTMRRIAPGVPESSYLVHKIQGTHLTVGGTGARMPLGGAPLTPAQIAMIRSWISAGAADN